MRNSFSDKKIDSNKFSLTILKVTTFSRIRQEKRKVGLFLGYSLEKVYLCSAIRQKKCEVHTIIRQKKCGIHTIIR